MPCRFASSGTVATSRSASRAILALNVASNFLRDLVISVLRRLRQSRTLHTLTFGPISGVHFSVGLESMHNFGVMAQGLLNGESRFLSPCDFKELGVAKRPLSTTSARSAVRQPWSIIARTNF